MRSSTLLTLMAAFGPLAVISSPRPPPEWVEIEIIPISWDTAELAHYTNWPGATNTADTSLGAGATGTLTGSIATITGGTEDDKDENDDECETDDDEDSSLSLTDLDTYETATGSLSTDTGLATDTGLSAATSMTSASTTLSTSLVAKLRRQFDNPSSSTATSATDTSIASGITAPAGYLGTGLTNTALPSVTAGAAAKKVKGNGCTKGVDKALSKGLKTKSGQATATGISALSATGTDTALTDLYGAAASSSMTAAAATSSAAMRL